MNILFFTAGLGLGGTERASVDIALYFKEQYNRNVFFLSFFDGTRRKDLEEAGISPLFCNYDNQNKQLNSLIEKHNIDVLYVRMVGWESITIASSKKITLLNQVIFSGGYSSIPTYNIVISHALNYKIHCIYPEARSKVVYFPFNKTRRDNVQSIKPLEELKKQYNIPSNLFLIGRVARPELTKWGWNFISNIKYILKKDKQVGLILVGLPRIYKIFLISFTKRIRYFPTTGNDAYLSQIYSLLDCYYHTAEVGETFGMVLAEAMYFGLPIISHSTDFQKKGTIDTHMDNSQIELVTHGENGYISNNRKRIYAWVQKLKTNKPYYTDISERNRKKVETTYDINIIAQQLHDIIIKKENIQETDSSKDMYLSQLSKIHPSDIYKYREPIVIRILKYLYIASRFLLRKIGIDIEKYRITKEFI